ncbi:hypothetical protein R3P38DRAFT_3202938 [Favolaschia claudopus]|uniref:Uncharacterized protein n=1 Tax=Favolaschia claudopus TaxID=2862362 RepID=A0AAW0AVG0_9AGAR
MTERHSHTEDDALLLSHVADGSGIPSGLLGDLSMPRSSLDLSPAFPPNKTTLFWGSTSNDWDAQASSMLMTRRIRSILVRASSAAGSCILHLRHADDASRLPASNATKRRRYVVKAASSHSAFRLPQEYSNLQSSALSSYPVSTTTPLSACLNSSSSSSTSHVRHANDATWFLNLCIGKRLRSADAAASRQLVVLSLHPVPPPLSPLNTAAFSSIL